VSNLASLLLEAAGQAGFLAKGVRSGPNVGRAGGTLPGAAQTCSSATEMNWLLPPGGPSMRMASPAMGAKSS
jgi:hypothetical protein